MSKPLALIVLALALLAAGCSSADPQGQEDSQVIEQTKTVKGDSDKGSGGSDSDTSGDSTGSQNLAAEQEAETERGFSFPVADFNTPILVGLAEGDSVILYAQASSDSDQLGSLTVESTDISSTGQAFLSDGVLWHQLRTPTSTGWVASGVAFMGAPTDISEDITDLVGKTELFDDAQTLAETVSETFLELQGNPSDATSTVTQVTVSAQQTRAQTVDIVFSDGEVPSHTLGYRLVVGSRVISAEQGRDEIAVVQQFPLCNFSVAADGTCAAPDA